MLDLFFWHMATVFAFLGLIAIFTGVEVGVYLCATLTLACAFMQVVYYAIKAWEERK